MAAAAAKGATATDSITVFLANVQLWTSIIGFIIQIWLTSKIHRYLGIGFALMILPVSLGTSGVDHAAQWRLCGRLAWPACSTSPSVTPSTRRRGRSSSCRCPADIKLKAKSFVDVTVDRGAKALGALLLLRPGQAVGPEPELAATELREPDRDRAVDRDGAARQARLPAGLPARASSGATSRRPKSA